MDSTECANIDYGVIDDTIMVDKSMRRDVQANRICWRSLFSCDATGCPNCYAGGKGCNVGLIGETLWLNYGNCNSGGNSFTAPVCKRTR